MVSYIKKVICGKELYYKGHNQWTEMFTERKQFSNESDANEEHCKYSGIIIKE